MLWGPFLVLGSTRSQVQILSPRSVIAAVPSLSFLMPLSYLCHIYVIRGVKAIPAEAIQLEAFVS
ncbi:hypothetical protein EV03_0056 [Prochlorococcus marinus str. PAC1]|uniref:Uncharacterized protein n=1 Tax=Prochlorococcus marinus str. PAC1 TaxID=59924 RepID=A0A0A2C8B3_PROMR|nr:hypothetical protein EV03_0056 [Prochlorococcus marinus str. PAC1]